MREAMADTRRRPGKDQPAAPGRAGHRPLGHRRRLRPPGRVRAQHRAGVRAQRRALPVPALGPEAFDELQVVPPDTGICHQVNLEYLARVVFDARRDVAYPDTAGRHRLAHHDGQRPRRARAGASAASRPRRRCSASRCRMLIPRVVGFKLTGELPEGTTATDLVLTITEMLRKHGVVGKFVEFYGAGRRRGAAGQPGHDRQHEPGVRLDLRDLPDRRGDPALPAAHRPPRRAGRARRGLREGAGPVARPGRTSRPTPRRSSSTWRPSCRRSPARSGRRTGCRWTSAKRRSAPRSATTRPRSRSTRCDEASTSPSRPPTPSRSATADDGAVRAAAERAGARVEADPVDAGRRHVVELDHGAVVIAAITSLHQHVQPVGDDRRRRCSPRTPSRRA